MDEDIESVPREQTFWTVTTDSNFEGEDSDGEECVQRMVTVTDAKSSIISVNVIAPAKLDDVTHVMRTLRDAMLHPFTGRPRRPTRLLVQEGPHLSEADLERLGLAGCSEVGECGCHFNRDNLQNFRACSGCRRTGDAHLFIPCPECGVVFYCDQHCREADAGVGEHGHRRWCMKIRSYMEEEPDLSSLPFTFSKETTGASFGICQYQEFLKLRGVYGRGLWQREAFIQCPKHKHAFGDLPVDPPHYVLPLESGLLASRPVDLDGPPVLTCWQEYYRWRGLPLTSPVSLLLTFPLTLYHVITSLLLKHYPKKQYLSSEMNICLVGVEKEADMIAAFKEVGVLLPHLELNLCLVGPEVSRKAENTSRKMENVTVTLHRGLYHSLSLPRPDVAIGFNAGLGAYGSWQQTLTKLRDQDVPAFFTDYCRYSCECLQAPLQTSGIGSISQVEINPFRSPIRRYTEEHVMPCYSNAFIYSLQYTKCPME